MKTFGLIANGKVIENVTVTMQATDIDEQQTQEICVRKKIEDDNKVKQVRDSVQKRNMGRRLAQQGATDVRIFPIAA